MNDKEKESSDIGKNKLTIAQKDTVLKWIAEGYKSKEVAELIEDNFNISFTRQSVNHYQNTYKNEIYDIRQEMNRNIKRDVDLANKAVRVRKLTEAAAKAMQMNDMKNYRLILKDIANEMGDLQDSLIIKGEVKGLIGQLVTIIQHEVDDEETIKKIAKQLQGVKVNE